jgi:hypothetical protein
LSFIFRTSKQKAIEVGVAVAVASAKQKGSPKQKGSHLNPSKAKASAAAVVSNIALEASLQDSGDLELLLNYNVDGFDESEEESQIFTFVLAAKEVAKIDELESKLWDAFEKIRLLENPPRVEKKVAFLSLAASSAVASGGVVTWNGQSSGGFVRAVTTTHFDVAANNQSVTVLKRGVYQIHVRLGETNNGNGNALSLRVNGVSIAQCSQSDGGNHQNTAQITEIVQLEPNSVLSVVCGANGNSLADILKTRFTVLLLEEDDLGNVPSFLSLSSQTAAANGALVTWNGTQPNVIDTSLYTLAAQKQTVTVLKRGLYQIHVRVGQTNSANTTSLTLVLNGTNMAQCVQSDASGHQNTAQISEVALLESGAVLSVLCGASNNSLGDMLKTRFSIVLVSLV